MAGPGHEQVRLALRVVVLLSLSERLEPGDVAPPESTQQGMAARLRVTQGAISKVLRRLSASDVVGHERHHVRGEARRMQVYYLTPRGWELATRYRADIPQSEIILFLNRSG